MSVNACTPLLSTVEVIETVLRHLVANNLFVSRDYRCRRILRSWQHPDNLFFKEKEPGLAAVDNWVVDIISINDPVISGSQEEEANQAFCTVAFASASHMIHLFCESIQLRIVNVECSIITSWISGLDALTILKEKVSQVSFLLVPYTQILIEIQWRLCGNIWAPSQVQASLHWI